MKKKKSLFLPDIFTIALVITVIAATFFPCHGEGAALFEALTHFAIGLLFFLHGAKLSREAIVAGATHWRLHLVTLCCTFVLFPLLGLALRPILSPLVTSELYVGILFLCMLPSTVQSSIAFTSMAGGNVPASICGASASNILGIFLTPVLVGLFVTQGGNAPDPSAASVLRIVQQLLIPFMAGHLSRRWIGGWVDRHKALLRPVDQGSILLVVYTAFSEAVNEGLWRQIAPLDLAGLFVVCCILLGLLLLITTLCGRLFHFCREDRISIVFCGSKKSLASGVPIAKVLFTGHAVGSIVLPLMLFHQIQLMVCAVLAQHYAKSHAKVQKGTGSHGAP
ncbi:bile acid:sodium symporter [Geomonas sp. RF6]|uniref:bile acid:sodium symporter family protein n=1 Tax=Geomonas sp. RF6 TaxID=2897342 RepID=UPI001E4F0865|nr:bile acid:sodium symporter family protein [Geomonas sp. RF6]UFS72109.1 bile acid:sodium symporter [Geomonas sp. RF6]